MNNAAMLRQRIAARAATPTHTDPANFVPADVLSNAASLTRDDIDRLDFGAVRCDDAGVVLLYNRYQSRFANLTPSSVEGRNFFTQVAPCTNNNLFYGAFKRGVASRNLNLTFPYTFTYRIRPTSVMVHLYRTGSPAANWIFLRPL